MGRAARRWAWTSRLGLTRKGAFTRVKNVLHVDPHRDCACGSACDGGFRSCDQSPRYDCQRLQRGAGNIDRRLRARSPLPARHAFVATPALAQDYPNRPIRIIVQTPPGGLIDQIGAHLRAEAHREHRQHRRRREPHRRRRADRRRARAEFAARRLHRLCRLARLAGDPSASHQESVVRSGEGVRAGDPISPPRRRCWSCIRRCRRRRCKELIALRQGQSRQAHLRVAGQRLVRPRHPPSSSGSSPASTSCTCPTRARRRRCSDLVAGHVSLMFDTVAFSGRSRCGRQAARARESAPTRA